MAGSGWTRLLTGVGAGSARLRDAVGARLRPAVSALSPVSLQQIGGRASARLRQAFSTFSPLPPGTMQRYSERASARPRPAVSALSTLLPGTIQRYSERASARLRPAVSALSPRLPLRPGSIQRLGVRVRPAFSVLRPGSIQRYGERASARLRPAFYAFRPASASRLARLRVASGEMMRSLSAEAAKLRPGPCLRRLRGARAADFVDEEHKLTEETARFVIPAILRRPPRFRPLLKAFTDAVVDYNRLKDLVKRVKFMLRRRKKKHPRRLLRAPPVPEPVASTWLRLAAVAEPPADDTWVILARVPRVVADCELPVVVVADHGIEELSEVQLPVDVDFFIEWRTPLAVSTITVRASELVSAVPVAPGRRDYPYVVALAEHAAVFLLRARSQPQPQDEDDGLTYMVCDAETREATLVPPEFAHRLLHAGNIGLACAGHLVVELKPLPGGRAILERLYVFPDTAFEHAALTVVYPPGE